MRLDVERFLEDVTGRYAAPYIRAVHDMVVAEVTQNRIDARLARERLAAASTATLGIGEVLGASLVLQEAAPHMEEAGLAFAGERGRLLAFAGRPIQMVVPNVTFSEAVRDMVERTPVTLRDAAERTAHRISQLYGEGHVVAFARSAEDVVTREAQRFIREAIRRGVPTGEAGKRLAMSVNRVRKETQAWSEAYARMAFRTNLNTATTAGRFRQVKDPDVRRAIPALRFDAVGDADTRDNHLAADGLIFAHDNPVWHTIAPPLGYNSFVPGTLVSGNVDTASKAFYSGPLVVLYTREGGRLAVTPNHPVLEPTRGFVPAGEIREGDHLVSHLPNVEALESSARDGAFPSVQEFRRAIHDQHVIPRIEDVFDAARMNGAAPSVEGLARPLPLDFHGDAGFYEGEVHVVSLDVLLPLNSPLSQAPLHGRHEPLLQLDSWSPGAIAHRSGLAISGRGGSGLLGSVPEFYASASEDSIDHVSGGSSFFREMENRCPREIRKDRVVRVEVHSFSGHVYDLQSPLGWIVANGFIASNCRCRVSLVSVVSLRRLGKLSADGSVVDDRLPASARPDPGFRHGGRPDLALAEVT